MQGHTRVCHSATSDCQFFLSGKEIQGHRQWMYYDYVNVKDKRPIVMKITSHPGSYQIIIRTAYIQIANDSSQVFIMADLLHNNCVGYYPLSEVQYT